jgi:hypothetical protein
VLSASAIISGDPRFAGTETVTANANFNAQYAGQVWGRWNLVVDGGAGDWDGTWHGTRTYHPGEGPAGGDAWVAEIELVGAGSGSVEHLHVSASERILTYTAIPVPYEALGVCAPGTCPAEGAIQGHLSRDASSG